MSTIKFNIEGEVISVEEELVNLSVLLKTTLSTDLPVDLDEQGNPIVEIISKRDINILHDYYYHGIIVDDIVEAFDRLIIQPRYTKLDKLKYYWIDKLCPKDVRDSLILTVYLPVYTSKRDTTADTVKSIYEPVQRFQDYGILLNGIKKPEIYTLIPIHKDGPRGNVIRRFSTLSTKEKYTILDDVCYTAYDTLKKYHDKYTHMIVISDSPRLYSYVNYLKYNVLPLRHN